MSIFEIIYFIIAGGVIGLIARAVVPGRQDLSLVLTILLGIVGMVIGAVVGSVIPPDNNGVPWILGTLSAIVLLFAMVRTGYLARLSGSN